MSFHKYKRKRVQIVSLICYEKWNIFGWVSNSLVISRVIALATMNGCAYDLVNLYQAGSIEHTHENVDKYKKMGSVSSLFKILVPTHKMFSKLSQKWMR